MRNGRRGSASSFSRDEAAFAAFGLVEETCLDGFLGPSFTFGNRRMTNAGEMRRMLRSRGAEEYAVMAKRMAPTLRRKSAISATGPYGVKNDFRD